MPAGQPFTRLCRQLSAGPRFGRVDLHTHSTASDGSYTPSQLVDLARRSGLAALALTDHDTCAGLAEARAAAAGLAVEIVPGVEITAEHRGREVHLLAYFFDASNPSLIEALAEICRQRVVRYRAMVDRLRAGGIALSDDELTSHGTPSALGRRHLAEVLVKSGRAASVRDVFRSWLGDRGRAMVPKERRPAKEMLALVHAAGGVAALAHPPYDLTQDDVAALARDGLGALEVEYPDMRPSWSRALRGWATAVGLAVVGGSDCHGPGPRAVGARSISRDELERLRDRCRDG